MLGRDACVICGATACAHTRTDTHAQTFTPRDTYAHARSHPPHPPVCALPIAQFEAAAAHEIGHILGFNHPDVADNPNYVAGAGPMGASICRSPLADIERLTNRTDRGVAESIMFSTTTHRARACLTQDDLDGLNYLYPSCDLVRGSPPLCVRSKRRSGYLRLTLALGVPMAVGLLITHLLMCHAARRERKRFRQLARDMQAIKRARRLGALKQLDLSKLTAGGRAGRARGAKKPLAAGGGDGGDGDDEEEAAAAAGAEGGGLLGRLKRHGRRAATAALGVVGAGAARPSRDSRALVHEFATQARAACEKADAAQRRERARAQWMAAGGAAIGGRTAAEGAGGTGHGGADVNRVTSDVREVLHILEAPPLVAWVRTGELGALRAPLSRLSRGLKEMHAELTAHPDGLAGQATGATGRECGETAVGGGARGGGARGGGARRVRGEGGAKADGGGRSRGAFRVATWLARGRRSGAAVGVLPGGKVGRRNDLYRRLSNQLPMCVDAFVDGDEGEMRDLACMLRELETLEIEVLLTEGSSPEAAGTPANQALPLHAPVPSAKVAVGGRNGQPSHASGTGPPNSHPPAAADAAPSDAAAAAPSAAAAAPPAAASPAAAPPAATPSPGAEASASGGVTRGSEYDAWQLWLSGNARQPPPMEAKPMPLLPWQEARQDKPATPAGQATCEVVAAIGGAEDEASAWRQWQAQEPDARKLKRRGEQGDGAGEPESWANGAAAARGALCSWPAISSLSSLGGKARAAPAHEASGCAGLRYATLIRVEERASLLRWFAELTATAAEDGEAPQEVPGGGSCAVSHPQDSSMEQLDAVMEMLVAIDDAAVRRQQEVRARAHASCTRPAASSLLRRRRPAPSSKEASSGGAPQARASQNGAGAPESSVAAACGGVSPSRAAKLDEALEASTDVVRNARRSHLFDAPAKASKSRPERIKRVGRPAKKASALASQDASASTPAEEHAPQEEPAA